MRKLSKINEGMFDQGIKRAHSKEVRKEDGVKVKTCLGNTVILQNPDLDYNDLLKSMLNPILNAGICFNYFKNLRYTDEELSNIKNDKDKYNHIIQRNNSSFGDNLVVQFDSYHSIIVFELDKDFDKKLSEKDYIALCDCLTEKIKEIGEHITEIPKKSWYLNLDDKSNKYREEFHIKLIDEVTVYHWLIDQDDYTQETYVNDFIESISSKFPELKDIDFFGWTFYNGLNIGIPLTIDTILNCNDYCEFAENYFKS